LLNLIATTTSPYGRKVRIALAEKKFEFQFSQVSPWTPDNPVHAWNPLGKVPVLVLDDGTPARVVGGAVAPIPGGERLAHASW